MLQRVFKVQSVELRVMSLEYLRFKVENSE